MAVNEYRKAFLIVWNIVSIVILFGFLCLILLPQSFILKTLPICVYQQANQQACFLCGMGRALILIARGYFSAAMGMNHLSLPFVMLLVWNEILWLLYLKRSDGKGKII
jgi:hypothetical protein